MWWPLAKRKKKSFQIEDYHTLYCHRYKYFYTLFGNICVYLVLDMLCQEHLILESPESFDMSVRLYIRSADEMFE